MKLLKDKTAIVTGGSRGIGKAIVLKLAQYGANVIFTYLSSSEQAELVVQKALKYGVQVDAVQSDASKYNCCQDIVSFVLDKYHSVDILVNNAGITKDNLLLRMSEEDFDTVLRVNMKSVFNMTKSVQKNMLSQRKGTIINLSSIVAIKGNAGQANYSASKAAIIGFSKSIALELGSRNIRSNVVAPGYIETDMTQSLSSNAINEWVNKIPLNRVGLTDDVANTVLFLSSDLSSYITGQVINVCGGMAT